MQNVLVFLCSPHLYTAHTHTHKLQHISLLFPYVTDEPDSKKLAAQSDLDSAKALCEFHPAILCFFLCAFLCVTHS